MFCPSQAVITLKDFLLLIGVYCGEPRSPPQGGVKALHGYYYFESEVKYECNPRYKMIGSDLRKCLANGRWEGTPPRCVGMIHSVSVFQSVSNFFVVISV